jgi:Dockerin type I domain
VIHVRENDHPHHNHGNPYDVDHSGHVTALDALAIINYLNTYGPGPVEPTDNGFCYDVNRDAMVTALDALLVLNEMNRIQNGSGTVGSGEGEKSNHLSTPPSKNIQRNPNPVSGSKDEVFGQWGSSRKSSPINTTPSSPSQTRDWTVEEASEETSRDEFARNVDQSLRLLTDSDE